MISVTSLKLKKATLTDLLDVKVQGALISSRFHDVMQMDAPSKFFFQFGKDKWTEQIDLILDGKGPAESRKQKLLAMNAISSMDVTLRPNG